MSVLRFTLMEKPFSPPPLGGGEPLGALPFSLVLRLEPGSRPAVVLPINYLSPRSFSKSCFRVVFSTIIKPARLHAPFLSFTTSGVGFGRTLDHAVFFAFLELRALSSSHPNIYITPPTAPGPPFPPFTTVSLTIYASCLFARALLLLLVERTYLFASSSFP